MSAASRDHGLRGYAEGMSADEAASSAEVAAGFPKPAGRTPPDLAFWVALGTVTGMWSASLWLLVRRFGDLSQAWSAGTGALVAAGLRPELAEAVLAHRERTDPEAPLRRLEAIGGRAIAWDDPAYPRQLREIPDPPPLLYVRGDLGVASFERSVAIVGTRRISAYGRQATEQLAQELARAGVCVVSGMAAGVDTAAHRAALEAGGCTVAVWGTGLDSVYPASNRGLARRIVESGAVVTEYPLGMVGMPENFPQRNRIISGLARGTVVVEAPRDSGALITARFALEQNREIMAVPGDVFQAGSQGTNRLVFRGEARAVCSARDVLETLQIDVPPVQLALEPAVEPTDEERTLLAHLSATPVHIDLLARAAAMPAHRVSSVLSIMEIRGLARHMGSGTYAAARPEMGATSNE